MTVSNILVAQSGLLSDLAGWKAGDLASCVIRLYQNNRIFTPADVPADYTECNFTGYAPISSPAWGVPFINLSGDGEMDSPNLVWTFTGSSGTQFAYGMYVTDSSQTKLFLVVPFLVPFKVAPATPTVSQILQLTAAALAA
jgi:hypothetical protein